MNMQEWWLPSMGAAERSYPTSKVRASGQEELPHIQGNELQLCFSGTAMKGYPMYKVRESQVRW